MGEKHNCGNCADIECADWMEAGTGRTRSRKHIGPCHEWKPRPEAEHPGQIEGDDGLFCAKHPMGCREVEKP